MEASFVKKHGYGDFGNLATQYNKARQGFPEEVFTFLWAKIKKLDPYILDVGCGTGIPTRQLAQRGAKVIGSDNNREMIRMAKKNSQRGISYISAPADKLPFKDNRFDAVTVFSAFHWFANQNSIIEMKRVLRPGGILFIANKNDVGGFKNGYKAVLKEFIERRELPDIKKDYNPQGLLKKANLYDIEEATFEASEYFTLPQAIKYLQSVSLWNLVPDSSKPEASAAIERYCRKNESNGIIERKLKIIVIVGRK